MSDGTSSIESVDFSTSLNSGSTNTSIESATSQTSQDAPAPISLSSSPPVGTSSGPVSRGIKRRRKIVPRAKPDQPATSGESTTKGVLKDDDDDDFFILNKHIEAEELSEISSTTSPQKDTPEFASAEPSNIETFQDFPITSITSAPDSNITSVSPSIIPALINQPGKSPVEIPEPTRELHIVISDDEDTDTNSPNKKARYETFGTQTVPSRTLPMSNTSSISSHPISISPSLSPTPMPLSSESIGSTPVPKPLGSYEQMLLNRKKRRNQSNNVPSFRVGLSVTTKISGFENVPLWKTLIHSTDAITISRPNYLKYLMLKSPGFFYPEQDIIFVRNNQRIFDHTTPAVLNVTKDSAAMYVDAMLQHEFEAIKAKQLQDGIAQLKPPDYDKLGEQALAAIAERTRVEAEAAAKSESPSVDGTHFPIQLKGKDNKPIIVKVSAETPIEKIAKYFCERKEISEADSKKIRLVFDDEDIDMSGTVGDTELEADFTVDVYVD